MQTLVQIQNTINRMQKHDLKPKIKSIIKNLVVTISKKKVEFGQELFDIT
jgi:hypothetical protein